MCTQGPTHPLPDSPTDTRAVVPPLYSGSSSWRLRGQDSLQDLIHPQVSWLGSSNYSFRLFFMFKMKYFWDFCWKDTKLTEGFEGDSAFFQYWSFYLAMPCYLRDPSFLTKCQTWAPLVRSISKCQAVTTRPPGNPLSAGSSGTHHIHFIFIKYMCDWHVKVYS